MRGKVCRELFQCFPCSANETQKIVHSNRNFSICSGSTELCRRSFIWNAELLRLGPGCANLALHTQQITAGSLVLEGEGGDSLPVTAEEFLATAACEFRVSPQHLAQTCEYVGGRYIPIRWTNILPPHICVEMSVRDAVRSISALPLAPEVCLNK